MATINKLYFCDALTGGADGALDAINGLNLRDGDLAIVLTSTTAYYFILDADSGLTESSPDRIVPDSNPSTKVWIKKSLDVDTVTNATVVTSATTVTNATTVTSATTVTTGTTVTNATTVTTGTTVTNATTVESATTVTNADAVTTATTVTTGTTVTNATTVTTGTTVTSATTVTTGTTVTSATTVTNATTVTSATTVTTATTVESADTVTNATNVYQQGTLATNANGNPNISDTVLVVDTTVTEEQWWAVYPTAGSPDETYVSNKTIWTALDSVPSSADWIKVRILCDAGVGSSTVSFTLSVSARKNGGNESSGTDNMISWLKGQATAEVEVVASVVEVTIPVDNGCFDIYWDGIDLTSQSIFLILVGYGSNP